MPLNLLRTCVGVESVEHLCSLFDGRGRVSITTRYMPKRRDEILEGGSLYWIIKRQVQCRQAIVDMRYVTTEGAEDGQGGETRCVIDLNPQIVIVSPRAQKHIQGWRYLPEDKSPKDLYLYDSNAYNLENIPEDMRDDLKEAGLI